MNALLSAYPQIQSRDISQPWLMAIPVISTVHIPASDRIRLANDNDALAPIRGGLGHIVMIDDLDDWENYSPEFQTLLSAFADLGYQYLRLDADGDEIDGWQTFD